MNTCGVMARLRMSAPPASVWRAALLLLTVATPASGVDPTALAAGGFHYHLQGGIAFSDNRLRLPGGADDDLYLDGVLGFTWRGDTPRLAWRGSGQLQASQSLRGGRGERPRAELALALDWTLLEQRLFWHAAQLAAIERIDPLQADTPANRQQTHISVTGPSLLLGTPSTWLARLDARLAVARAEESAAFDHRRHSLAASLQRHSTPVLRWTLLGEHADVAFRRSGAMSDFVRDDLLLRAERRLPRGLLSLAMGRTRIDPRRGDTLQRPLWQASLTLAARAGGELQFNYADALTDAGRDLALLDDPAERLWQEGRRARIDGSLYRLRSLDLAWRQEGERLGWSLTPFLRRVDYTDADAVGEHRSQGVRGALAYRFSPRWTLQAEAATSRHVFTGVTREDRDRGARLGIERQLAPRWSLRLGASRFLRRSSQASAGYAENVLSLFLIYRSDP